MGLDDGSMQPSASHSSEPDPALSANGTGQLDASHSTTPLSNLVDVDCISVGRDAPAELEGPRKRGRPKQTVVSREMYFPKFSVVDNLVIDPNARNGITGMHLHW